MKQANKYSKEIGQLLSELADFFHSRHQVIPQVTFCILAAILLPQFFRITTTLTKEIQQLDTLFRIE